MNNPPHYTRTLARLYAEQGYHDKAVEIYRHLMRKFPDRRELLEDVSALEARMREAQTTNEPALSRLFQEWLDLLTKYRQVRNEALSRDYSRL